MFVVYLPGTVAKWSIISAVVFAIIFVLVRRRENIGNLFKNATNSCADMVAGNFIMRTDVTDRLLQDESFMARFKSKLLGDTPMNYQRLAEA